MPQQRPREAIQIKYILFKKQSRTIFLTAKQFHFNFRLKWLEIHKNAMQRRRKKKIRRKSLIHTKKQKDLDRPRVVWVRVPASSESASPGWPGRAKLPCWKTHLDGWLEPGPHILGETYLLTYKLDACVKTHSGIFVIIASSLGRKLFMESIQCKQVRAHIGFSLTAQVLDHADIELLGDLILSRQTLKGGPLCWRLSNLQPTGPLLRLYLKVQWVNAVLLPPRSHPPGPSDVR